MGRVPGRYRHAALSRRIERAQRRGPGARVAVWEPAGRIVRERTKLLVIVVFDAPAHRGKVREIVEAYNSRFGQHSVFRSEQPVCAGL